MVGGVCPGTAPTRGDRPSGSRGRPVGLHRGLGAGLRSGFADCGGHRVLRQTCGGDAVSRLHGTWGGRYRWPAIASGVSGISMSISSPRGTAQTRPRTSVVIFARTVRPASSVTRCSEPAECPNTTWISSWKASAMIWQSVSNETYESTAMPRCLNMAGSPF
jgi:hypothetical protein